MGCAMGRSEGRDRGRDEPAQEEKGAYFQRSIHTSQSKLHTDTCLIAALRSNRLQSSFSRAEDPLRQCHLRADSFRQLVIMTGTAFIPAHFFHYLFHLCPFLVAFNCPSLLHCCSYLSVIQPLSSLSVGIFLYHHTCHFFLFFFKHLITCTKNAESPSKMKIMEVFLERVCPI